MKVASEAARPGYTHLGANAGNEAVYRHSLGQVWGPQMA